MALTVGNPKLTPGIGDYFLSITEVDFDSSYPVGGESLTSADLGFDDHATDLRVWATTRLGYTFEFVAGTPALRAYWPNLGLSHKTVAISDDDNAATTGVALYVHIDEVVEQGTCLGHLECANAGNADSYFTPYSGGPVVPVQDDDNAATTGLALYFDEDATAGLRLMADFDRITGTSIGPSVLIPAEDGTFLKIDDIDAVATPGVQVYFDDDAANTYERLLFVSPTNVDGTDRIWTPGGEVPNATDLSDLTTVLVYALGRKKA